MDNITISQASFQDAGTAAGTPSRGKSTGAGQASQSTAVSSSSSQDIATQASQEQIAQALAELKQDYGMTVEMTQDQASGQAVARIYSADGKHLIRQMPPEAVLRMVDTLRSGGHGGLLVSHV